MPGLVGIVTKMPRQRAACELEQMLGTMRHESFHVTGAWIDESLGVYVGWSVHRGSFADGMPLRTERDDVVLVFSGEDFPAPGTIDALKERGHDVGGRRASYLVHQYEEQPETFPDMLNGRFHGLVVDRRRQTATLFNDRFGMHRLYYHESKDALYFAAEAKALLAVVPGLRELDHRSLGEFIACGCVLENRTLFEKIRVLPGAARWTFRGGALAQTGSYFEPGEWEQQTTLELEPYYRALRETFARQLPRYFEGPERIGMSLTGGLDTRMVMAWRRSPPGSLPCYSFGGMFRDCEDVRVARKVARACQQPHEVLTVGSAFLSRFDRYAERSVYLTDGSVDVSVCPDLYLHEHARDVAPVRMTGNYGGEILRGVRAFKPVDPSPGLFHPELVSHVRDAGRTYSGLLGGHPLSFAAFQQTAWHFYGVLALEQSQVTSRTPYLDNELLRLVFRAPASASATDDLCLRLIADGNATLRRIPTDRGIGGESGPLASALTKQLLTFTFKADYAYDYGMPQWLASIDRHLAPLHPERLFLGRHKFCHFRYWYRDVLSDYVRQMLLDRRTLSRPYLESKQLETIVEGHVAGRRNYTTEIHKLITLELVQRLFFDRQSAPVQDGCSAVLRADAESASLRMATS
jgi:asparagine synthase (glutamine-hydrolysing)